MEGHVQRTSTEKGSLHIMKFNREQLVLMVDLALSSAMDQIDSCLPPTISPGEYRARQSELDNYIQGCINTAGMMIACIYAQTAGQIDGDGIGVADACAVIDFEKFCHDFQAKRLGGDCETIPEMRDLALKFVDKLFGDYLAEG